MYCSVAYRSIAQHSVLCYVVPARIRISQTALLARPQAVLGRTYAEYKGYTSPDQEDTRFRSMLQFKF